MTRGCWIDLFESPKFKGKMRRLFGPANYIDLRGSGTGWEIHITSLIVGPAAYVRLFAHHSPDRTHAWLLPGQSLADLAVIKMRPEFDSLRLLDRLPFSHEPGYGAFLKATQASTESSPQKPRKRRASGK